MFDCAQSLSRLSDFHDGTLNQSDRDLVAAHLDGCRPCQGIYQELNIIIVVAPELQEGDGIPIPDEQVFWQRLSFARQREH